LPPKHVAFIVQDANIPQKYVANSAQSDTGSARKHVYLRVGRRKVRVESVDLDIGVVELDFCSRVVLRDQAISNKAHHVLEVESRTCVKLGGVVSEVADRRDVEAVAGVARAIAARDSDGRRADERRHLNAANRRTPDLCACDVPVRLVGVVVCSRWHVQDSCRACAVQEVDVRYSHAASRHVRERTGACARTVGIGVALGVCDQPKRKGAASKVELVDRDVTGSATQVQARCGPVHHVDSRPTILCGHCSRIPSTRYGDGATKRAVA